LRQSFQANLNYYEFIAENGNEATLSFVARLPQTFPRSSKFELFPVRRVTFFVDSKKDLLLQQSPILTEIDETRKIPAGARAQCSGLDMEFWDNRQKDWVDEWRETNQIPKWCGSRLDRGQPNSRPRRAESSGLSASRPRWWRRSGSAHGGPAWDQGSNRRRRSGREACCREALCPARCCNRGDAATRHPMNLRLTSKRKRGGIALVIVMIRSSC